MKNIETNQDRTKEYLKNFDRENLDDPTKNIIFKDLIINDIS